MTGGDEGGRSGEAPIPLHDFLQLDFARGAGGPAVGEVTMPITPEACSVHGVPHGGAIATAVDLACALAAVRGTGLDRTTHAVVTSDLHVRYLGRPRTGPVVARAEVVRAGSTMVVVECRVTDGGGHLLATADVGMMVVPLGGRESAARP